jgi:hypothetical protein
VTAPALPSPGAGAGSDSADARRGFAAGWRSADARRGFAGRIGLACALAVAVAAIIAVSQVSSTPHPRAAAEPANPDSLIAGAPLQRARCSNWLAASPADKALAISALTAIAGAPTEYKGIHGTALTRDEGYQLLTNACSNPLAKHFLLYELYNRAAGFRPAWLAQQP